MSHGRTPGMSLAEFQHAVDAELASGPDPAQWTAIRRFNWAMVDELDTVWPLRDAAILDVGASPHGYALERALARGARRYVGIGLDIERPARVVTPAGAEGVLQAMDVFAMELPPASFDAILSVSTFEHLPDPRRALEAMARVLRPGGYLLATADPIWSSPGGHHLHQFGACAALIPPWGHLTLGAAQMRDLLRDRWPATAPLGLDAALAWIYEGPELNRLDIRQLRQTFAATSLSLRWTTEHRTAIMDPAALADAAARTGLAPADLEVRALVATLVKARAGWRGRPLAERAARRLRHLLARRPAAIRLRRGT